ncbi:MAG: M20/M25/M40 family metallo-hydrolase [Chitinophagales bacterium]|nr:M20/M25/M40 family metallo-hydrolase [Chitinophagales bacterium]
MKSSLLVALGFCATAVVAQSPEKIISVKEVTRIETALASDEMMGRRTGTPGIEKAADFIAAEFKKIGLKTWPGLTSYRQEFSILRARALSTTASWNDQSLAANAVMVITPQAELTVNNASGYNTIKIAPGDNLFEKAQEIAASGKAALVLVDKAHEKNFPRLSFLRRSITKDQSNLVFVLSNDAASSFAIQYKQEVTEQKMANVVGVLPGKSKANEYVVFSGHYDHLGIGKPDAKMDSIFNGANDDAAGTTAMIMLAKYYKKAKNNERTLVFAAFTAEEVGGFGSQYFSKQMDPNQVMAMFNIEMIGTDSKWGKNSAYITGYEQTNMGAILQKNLAGTGFNFYPDPYPDQQLFYRSDNATLARLGVPAHTISTSKMDSEPNYHKQSDEVSTLDMENMTQIIRSIALSARGIVAGKETPTRVNTKNLR